MFQTPQLHCRKLPGIYKAWVIAEPPDFIQATCENAASLRCKVYCYQRLWWKPWSVLFRIENKANVIVSWRGGNWALP